MYERVRNDNSHSVSFNEVSNPIPYNFYGGLHSNKESENNLSAIGAEDDAN